MSEEFALEIQTEENANKHKKLKVFLMEEGEWWADYNSEDAIENYEGFTGNDFDSKNGEYPEQLSEQQMKDMVVEDEEEGKVIFSDYLKRFTKADYFATDNY